MNEREINIIKGDVRDLADHAIDLQRSPDALRSLASAAVAAFDAGEDISDMHDAIEDLRRNLP